MRREPVDDLGPFHVHPGHVFEGCSIVDFDDKALLVARCGCGEVLDVADAAFTSCPECAGTRDDPRRRKGCVRCGGSGRIIDHAAINWRGPDDSEERHVTGRR